MLALVLASRRNRSGGASSSIATTALCPGTGGPAMVKLPEGYCIDSTEVTRAQYAAWLATNPRLPPKDTGNCRGKTSIGATLTPIAPALASDSAERLAGDPSTIGILRVQASGTTPAHRGAREMPIPMVRRKARRRATESTIGEMLQSGRLP